ncbi:MAG: hypothetical protein KGL19_13380 [Bacteroidota bacterium]|nr:hypothetical protein [Bacteroidota bacterium]
MQKKILLIIIASFIFLNADSQITKGNWMVGGSANYSTNNQYSIKSSNLQLAPKIGYFFWDNFSGGLQLNTILEKSTLNGSVSKQNSILIGPFMRYYFLNAEKSINFFVEATYSYGINRTTNNSSSNNTKLDSYSFLAGPVFYFNSSVGLEFTISYYGNRDIDAQTVNNGIQVGIGLQVHLEK